MKSVIDDYFGQRPKGDSSAQDSVEKSTDRSVKRPFPDEAPISNCEDVKVNGKENFKKKDKSIRTPKPKPSVASANHEGKKSQKKKSLSIRKQLLKEGNEDHLESVSCEEDKNSNSSPRNFALKIRMKSKEVHDEDDDSSIKEFYSPEHAKDTSNNSSKEPKTPQGSMLKYLVPQKNNSPAETDGGSKVKEKVHRDISDYFSPSKERESSSLSMKIVESNSCQSSPKDAKEGEEIQKSNAGEQNIVSVTSKSIKSKPSKKTSRKPLSVTKKNVFEKDPVPPASDVKDIGLETVNSNKKRASKLKKKPLKKSLSLTKDEELIESTEDCQEAKIRSNISAGLLAQSMTNALKKITETNDTMGLPSKKRKRDEKDDADNIVECKPLKTARDNSPKQTRKNCSKRSPIDSDSDDNPTGLKTEDNQAEDLNGATDSTTKLEEARRNSLMNYFSKVSKEEVLAKEEKIEMKVKALVHSPPTTPSKKVKRRSIHSLPGGAASLTKKKTSLKNKLKESLNAIEVIDNEELKSSDIKGKVNLPIPSKQLSISLLKPADKGQPQSNQSSPQKTLTLTKSSESSNDSSIKSSKMSPSRGKKKKVLTSARPLSLPAKPCKNLEVTDEESLATPLPASVEEPKVETTPVNTQTPWKLRVCLTPHQLPSTQNTLLEEESDCDEIFETRSEKKRKLEKHLDGGDKLQTKLTKAKIKISAHKEEAESPDVIFEKETRPATKIAPLFTRKADTQARQLFLQSGVPQQVKRALESQRSFEEHEMEIFPKESHIQQKDDKDWTWHLPNVNIPLKADCAAESPQPSCRFSLSHISGGRDILYDVDRIVSASCKGPEMRAVFGLPIDVIKPILRLIKQESPDFKVVNTFKALRTKLREDEYLKAAALFSNPDTEKPKRKTSNRKSVNSKATLHMPAYRAQLWTEKYKPSTASDIVGNSESVLQLKRWLEAWRKASEDTNNISKMNRDEMKRKRRRKDLLEDDDFMVSDNSSDGAHTNLPVGIAVLYGPNGSGKTSTVYALAKDLGYKVLEVNASEKRNGKLVLSKLSEATQSHQVQQNSTAEQGFAALFGNNLKSVKNKNKTSTKAPEIGSDMEEERAKKMSLILFEDVDVVFEEEDDGFLSAISNLVSTSKRPVILTTTDSESSMVSRFLNNASLILHFSCPSNLISTWLQIVSIVEGIYAAPHAVKDLVSICKGDFRRALHQMQLWVMSGANNLPMPSLTYSQPNRKQKKGTKIDEQDDLSDVEANNDDTNCTPVIPVNSDCIAAMLSGLAADGHDKGNQEGTALPVKVPYPVDLGLFWWNIPPLLSLQQIEHPPLPEKLKDDIPSSRQRRMLDDSFLSSFCSDDGNTTDSHTNEESDPTSSQGTSIGESFESQTVERTNSNNGLVSVDTPYKSCCSLEEMVAILHQMYVMSSLDIISTSAQLSDTSSFEPVSRFSQPLLKDSLSLEKSEVDGPNCLLNTMAESMCHWLAEESLNQTRTFLLANNSIEDSAYNHCLPKEEEYRWRNAHAEIMQVILPALPACAVLERQAIATDYMPTLRTLCRLERNRNIINTKRRNRFYHYLKSLGAHLTEAQLEIVCHTMQVL